MRRATLGWLLVGSFAFGLLSGGCKGAFTTPPEQRQGDGLRPLCGELGELLAISPDTTVRVGAGQLFRLDGRGGTRTFRWSLAENASGGRIEENTGVYVAGSPNPALEVTRDVVRLEDRNCRGEASATIEVVSAPSIAPRRVAVRPGESITFEASGGSGTRTFEIVANRSGGSIDPTTGEYVAGSTPGNDVVRMTDTELGRSPDGSLFDPAIAEATVEVSPSAGLTLSPSEWIVPLGSTVDLPVEGGSGELEVALSGAAFEHVEGSTVRAVAPGSVEITLTDRFTGRTVMANVRAVAPHQAERRLNADRSEAHVVVNGSYDIDGDGHFDAIVGMPDASHDWFASGVVRIYRGDGAGGLELARLIPGAFRDDELGRALALADIDEDGLLDLLVGARRADALRTDVGAVYVYSGVANGFFSEAPTRAWYGQAGSDLFGSGIEVCDFNADGHLDVAVAAPYGQEADGRTDQGVVRVFLFRPDSARHFATAPDVTLAGEVLAEGTWTAVQSLLFGESIASGDFDGDGACDLAASASGPSEAQLSTGMVALYRGRPASGSDRGGLETTPSLLWARADGVDDNARFGLRLGMGDVNGDGRADLVATRYLHDGAAGTDTGAIYLMHGRALSGPATEITDIAAADWSFEAARSQDRVGNALALADVDGDGRIEIVSGDSRAAPMESEIARPGIVRLWQGESLDAPFREYVGTAPNERFGLGLGAIGDLDGDGLSEIVAFAPYYDAPDVNDDRGALYLQRSSGAAPVALELEHPASGQQAGRSVAWVGDLDGDGLPELAVGAPDADVPDLVANAGVVRLYRGSAEGVSAEPWLELRGFTGHGDGDRFGHAVAPAGDFDGDGLPDLAVLAQYEDLGSLPEATYEVGSGCGSSRTNSGAVFVFRGTSGGLATEPSFVIFGPESGQLLDAVAGEIDVNGDGRDDLVIGGYRWDDGGASNAGGSMVVHGRAASDRIVAICTADRRINGNEANGYRGWSVAGIGDLNGDGCDEYAVGSPAADPNGRSSAGEVYVVFPACGASERIVRLYGTDGAAWGGSALAGGVDADGDGTPDLLIGAPRFRSPEGEVGRVFFVSGAYIDSLSSSGPFANGSSSARLFIDGSSPGERLGESVALVAGSSGAVAILGGPFGAAAGRVDTGGADVYDLRASGFAAAPRLRVSGEIVGQSQLGASVHGARAGDAILIGIGAPWSTAESGAWIDDGASYAFRLP